MKKVISVLILTLFCAGTAVFSQAIGKIDYLEGSVSVTRDGRKISRIDMGSPVENLDRITSGKDSRVEVSFLPETGITGTLTLTEGSSAIIRRDSLAGKNANSVYLFGGSVSLKVKRLSGNDSTIRVRTTSSVLGVRGTEFTVITFQGNTLTACREGEVSCSAYSGSTAMAASPRGSVSSVPGTMVEITDSGKLVQADFPKGDFYTQWDDVSTRWKSFHVELASRDPVALIDRLAVSWDSALGRVLKDAAVLRKNETASRWLDNARRGGDTGTRHDWVTEQPKVMKDMLAMRPHLVLAIIPYLRLQELVTLLDQADMERELSGGQTVGAFIRRFNRDSKDFSAAMALFDALEKQYMIRNDGISPFLDF